MYDSPSLPEAEAPFAITEGGIADISVSLSSSKVDATVED